MGNPYLYVLHIRLRDPENEPGNESDYMGVVGQWVDNPSGGKTHVEGAALTPGQLDSLGFKLPEIHQAINVSLSRDLDAMTSAKAIVEADLEKEVAASKALRKVNQGMEAAFTEHVKLAQAVAKDNEALIAELARISQEKAEDVANPVLNTLSFGLFGKS